METYCEETGLIFTENIDIQFRATNPAGTTTGGITTYIYDGTAPSYSSRGTIDIGFNI
jgi:hypothetical protein